MGPSLGDSQLLTSFYLLLDNVSLTKLIDGAVLLKLVFWLLEEFECSQGAVR